MGTSSPRPGLFGKGGLLGAPTTPDQDAPQWGAERGFSARIELPLMIGISAMTGALAYSLYDMFF